jgi:hypothetical protein
MAAASASYGYSQSQYGSLNNLGSAGYAQSGSYGQSTYQPDSNGAYGLPSFLQNPVQWFENEWNAVPGTFGAEVVSDIQSVIDGGKALTAAAESVANDIWMIVKIGLLLAVIVIALVAYKDLK